MSGTMSTAALRRQARREAAEAQATHQIQWDVRGVKTDEMLYAERGYTATALDGDEQKTAFVPVDEWANDQELCQALRSAGFEPLGFGFVRAH